MGAVFISSVIVGFEECRQAAKEAVELMDHTPIMAENFGARAYSSEVACINEVEQSDIYLLLLGSQYGFMTDEGISVTHSEFHAAKAASRPILVFVQQCEMEPKQNAFKEEVEAYQSGFFRVSFSTAQELKDHVIRALRQLDTISQAVSEEKLKEKIDTALGGLGNNWDNTPELILAFLPQPERMVDIVRLEGEMDGLFKSLSDTGITQLRDGYEILTEAHWTGLKSDKFRVACFADGLVILLTNPTMENDSLFSGYFMPPDDIECIAKGFRALINTTSGYVHIRLRKMGNIYVAPLPAGDSFSMGAFSGDEQSDFSRLFVPLTVGAYENWIGHCVNRFSRLFSYKVN